MTTDAIVVDIKCGLCEILASDNHTALDRENKVRNRRIEVEDNFISKSFGHTNSPVQLFLHQISDSFLILRNRRIVFVM